MTEADIRADERARCIALVRAYRPVLTDTERELEYIVATLERGVLNGTPGDKAEDIRAARLAGMTWRQICVKFGISETTARRYGDPGFKDKAKEYERTRYAKTRERTRHD